MEKRITDDQLMKFKIAKIVEEAMDEDEMTVTELSKHLHMLEEDVNKILIGNFTINFEIIQKLEKILNCELKKYI